MDYKERTKTNRDHVATPRWVVENIYDIINIKSYKNINKKTKSNCTGYLFRWDSEKYY